MRAGVTGIEKQMVESCRNTTTLKRLTTPAIEPRSSLNCYYQGVVETAPGDIQVEGGEMKGE